MAGGSRSKRKHNLEPISLEELAGTTGMSGFVAFLQKIPATEAAPGTTLTTTADPTPDVPLAPVVETTPVVPASLEASVTPGVDSPPAVARPPRPRMRRCQTAQDGHSLGEEALYRALWNRAAPETAATRLITIGWRGMSALCRLTPKNCKLNTHRLLRKLALEVAGSYSSPDQIGTTYRVYSYAAILERRRAAGLEWVVRSRGVEFVDPATGVELTPGDDQTPVVSTTPVVTGGDDSDAILRAVRQHCPHADHGIISDLVSSCRRRVPDAADEEIIHFIHLKGGGSPGVGKPAGFLLAAVPRCFEGEPFRQFRAEAVRRRDQQALREKEFRREAQAILDDSNATEEEKSWAREMLHPGGFHR